jgi:hypothetical protein
VRHQEDLLTDVVELSGGHPQSPGCAKNDVKIAVVERFEGESLLGCVRLPGVVFRDEFDVTCAIALLLNRGEVSRKFLHSSSFHKITSQCSERPTPIERTAGSRANGPPAEEVNT